MNVLAFSGGKDSTCLALRWAELGETCELLFTPTGRELPECIDHIARIATMTRFKLHVRACDKSLDTLIREQNCLPNANMRWCTRMLKIEVAKGFLLENPGCTLLVGLRADEEEREGMWGEFATYRYPIREWGWNEAKVFAYLDARGVTVPQRTDCDYCYDQRLGEWYRLWKLHPDRWEHAKELEKLTGYTFRSDTRDTWPAALVELEKRFAEAGEKELKRIGVLSLPLFGEWDEKPRKRCRVCSL